MRRHLARSSMPLAMAVFASCGGSSDEGSPPTDATVADTGIGTLDATDASDGAGETSSCVSCAPPQRCCADRCVTADGCDFAVTAVSPAGGYQNGGGWIHLFGAGFDTKTRVLLGASRAPAAAISATELVVQTPPGLPGPVDVIVTSG